MTCDFGVSQFVTIPNNTIVHGPCLSNLKLILDDSVDSVVTDPPYGLGDRDPTIEEIVAYLLGSELDMGEFMHKDWELPSVAVWKECFRVLKPGAFLFCFAGTRTQDILSIGIRAAGFENRDVIPAEMGPPILRWIRAQGMPKSTDLEKSIKGNVLARYGNKTCCCTVEKRSEFDPSQIDPRRVILDSDASGSDPVARVCSWCGLPDPVWIGTIQGFGTALKPYWEPILVFRKPIKERTVVNQVLVTGTGGINIEASRVKHSSKEDFEKHKAGVDAIKARGGKMGNSWKNSSDLSGANDVKTSGRFPPNLIMVHSDLCRKVGSEMVAMPPINRFDDGAKPFGGGAGHKYTTITRDDEEVEIWDCHHSCPIRWLHFHSGAVDKPVKMKGKVGPPTKSPNGASKYFVNIDPETTFFYVPKPSQAEKNEGLQGDENEHVSVKPVRLMEYLITMATPAKGLVLDPYCGSGTTCVAAVHKGFDFIGIEKEAASASTAQMRVDHALKKRNEEELQREAFNLMLELESE